MIREALARHKNPPKSEESEGEEVGVLAVPWKDVGLPAFAVPWEDAVTDPPSRDTKPKLHGLLGLFSSVSYIIYLLSSSLI